MVLESSGNNLRRRRRSRFQAFHQAAMAKAGEYTLHFLAAVVVAWLAVQLGIVLYVTCRRRGRDKQE